MAADWAIVSADFQALVALKLSAFVHIILRGFLAGSNLPFYYDKTVVN